MHFDTKNYLKNNRNYTTKQARNLIISERDSAGNLFQMH